MSFALQAQQRRSLKRNFIPQINLTSSFFPTIPKWREKNHWLLWLELHIKWLAKSAWYSSLHFRMKATVCWPLSPMRHTTCALKPSYPWRRLSRESSGLRNEHQMSHKQPVVQLLLYTEIHLNRQYLLFTVSKMTHKEITKISGISRSKIMTIKD